MSRPCRWLRHHRSELKATATVAALQKHPAIVPLHSVCYTTFCRRRGGGARGRAASRRVWRRLSELVCDVRTTYLRSNFSAQRLVQSQVTVGRAIRLL